MIWAGVLSRRQATTVFGSVQPAALANDVPRANAVSCDIPQMVALWITDRAKSPAAVGEAVSQHTEVAPADCPAIVTRFGSPPNAAMLRLTQRSASILSSSP